MRCRVGESGEGVRESENGEGVREKEWGGCEGGKVGVGRLGESGG